MVVKLGKPIETRQGTVPAGSHRRQVKRKVGPQHLSAVILGPPPRPYLDTNAAGSSGTVVHAYGGGQAYIIEFYEPFHAVATVEADVIVG
jgi:hypothetical protein